MARRQILTWLLIYAFFSTNSELIMAKKIDFEKSLAALEKLVEEMESGELSLDQSLATFEKGVSLTKLCQEALKDAELRVNTLLEKHGEAQLSPFNEND